MHHSSRTVAGEFAKRVTFAQNTARPKRRRRVPDFFRNVEAVRKTAAAIVGEQSEALCRKSRAMVI
jgi:hypothetical protein